MCDFAELQEGIYAAVNDVIPLMLHNILVDVNTGWRFPVSLMEAIFWFMEHKVKKSQFSLFVRIGFIYIFMLVQKL